MGGYLHKSANSSLVYDLSYIEIVRHESADTPTRVIVSVGIRVNDVVLWNVKRLRKPDVDLNGMCTLHRRREVVGRVGHGPKGTAQRSDRCRRRARPVELCVAVSLEVALQRPGDLGTGPDRITHRLFVIAASTGIAAICSSS